MSKKSMLLTMVALLVLPVVVSGQATVTASATVANYSALSGTTNLDFGTLSRTVDNTVDAAGGAGAGLRTLEYNHNVRVTFNNLPANLTTTVNSVVVNLPVSLTCASRIGAGAWSAAAACTQIDLDVGTTLTSATLGFGGTITAAAAANAPAGTYTGQFDIVVTAR